MLPDNHLLITTPRASELSAYYQTYLPEYSGIDMLQDLLEQRNSTYELLLSIPEDLETYRYAKDKWSLREVAGHIGDAERILAYRALRFSRKDSTELNGFSENDYTAASNYHSRTLRNIAGELISVRNASISLFSNMSQEMFELTGVANKDTVSVKALLFFIIAHQFHHVNVIRNSYL